MGMVWTPIATAMLMASSVATFLTMCHLRCRWDVHASSVRWLFWLFFLYVWVWCVLRAAYFLWMSLLPRKAFVDVDAPVYSSSGSQEDDPVGWTYEQFDRLGIHAILHLKDAKKPSITTLLIAGDVALFGIAICIFPLTYELWRLAKYSMDRGVKKEQKMIKSYAIGLHSAILVFASMQTSLAVVYNGYNVYTHRAVLCVYLIQFLSLGFMAVLLCMLKVNGRKYETIHGTFVASPVYQRLKRIMLVYAVFSFQYQLSTIIIYFHDNAGANGVVSGVGVSLIIYNASGLALSITTSCSQACVFSACAPCLPEDFEAEYLHRRFDGQSEAPAEEDLEAPTENPVFVYTDIESSSALWAVEDGEVMDKATEIHDDILRTTLPKHRGYEITTVGDAFQVAFHTIRDAVEYCMDVQLQLLVAKWPKELHGMVPATEKVRAGRKLIFNGLRVRMGIHDAAESEGTLVQDVHAVTGKTTYTGVSEIIAEYIGDLGCGGQILVTGRVATWLKHHCSDLTVDVFVERVGVYTVPQMNANVEVFQLLPAMLAGRARFFTPPEKGRKRQETRDSSRRADASRRLRRMASQNVNLHTVHAAQVSPKPRIFAFLETAQDANRAKSFRL